MVFRRYEDHGWGILSGVISLSISLSFFLGLLAYMLYRTPTIRASFNDGIIIDVFEQPAPIKTQLENFIGEQEKVTPPPPGAAKTIKNLFGETNTTASIDELLEEAKKASQLANRLPNISVDTGETDGRESRLKPQNLELAAFKAINSQEEGAGSSSGSKTPLSLEDSYYSEVYKRLYAAWQPGHSDLGKIARIDLRIERSGAMSYRIRTYKGDQPFVDRLTAALETIRTTGFKSPPHLMTLDVHFEVKE
ncbi:hypothetical protein AGMMS49521_0980 [Campylobacterota bacterium]|nr:hypothetical protein AGMMS49521_0980 [Campylobacterota bacterium]